jgi:hypothetical protein
VSPVDLSSMTPAQEGGWRTLLDLYKDFPRAWCLIGGQLVWLHARESGIDPPRVTEDVDVVIDIRVDQQALRRMCGWLEMHGFALDDYSPDGIGHRYISKGDSGLGHVRFDVLAPDNMGEHADLTTTPPARTVSAPGTRQALDSSEPIEVLLGESVGHVLRPPLLAAILSKAAATTITTRTNPDRDWADIAFLLSLIPDPVAAAAELTTSQKTRLKIIAALLDEDHSAWKSLGPRAPVGHATLEFLLGA